MSDRLLVGTRKGLFDLRRGGGSWAIASHAFLGEPVSMLLDDPRARTIHAALNLGHFGVKLHRSRDDGRSWSELPAPAFPKADGDDKAPSVALIWALETGGADRPGALWAGTIPGGLFRSPDGGESWSLVDSLWNRPERKDWAGGGYDQPGIHSISVDPRDSRRLVVAVSTGGVWSTADDGTTWRLDGKGLYAEYMPPDRRDEPNVQDVHRVVRCAAAPDAMWIQHHNGVFRSRDAGATWDDVTAVRPSKFGFAVAVHPRDPDTAWFVPAIKDERRVPVDGAMVVARTRDGGKSFDVLRDGLPQREAFDLVYRHGLAIDATGTRLAMGSTTGHLWVSENGGDSWTLVAGNLPPIACVRFAG